MSTTGAKNLRSRPELPAALAEPGGQLFPFSARAALKQRRSKWNADQGLPELQGKAADCDAPENKVRLRVAVSLRSSPTLGACERRSASDETVCILRRGGGEEERVLNKVWASATAAAADPHF